MSAHTLYIAEVLPYSLSSSVGQTGYSATGIKYDIAINAMPFFLAVSDATPYRRQTAPYRKEQVDLSAEPGEQSLVGWWVRAQSSFHRGLGIKFYDPSAGEVVNHRIHDCKGVDIWTKGQVTLLNASTAGATVAAQIASNGMPNQYARSIRWGTTNGILFHDDLKLDKIAADGTVTNFKVSSGTSIFTACDDGNNAYWITNSGGLLRLYKKPLSGSSASTADETIMFTHATIAVTSAVMEYTKERIIACINNSVYEITPSATVLPTALYTHPDPNYVFTSITASGPAIYVSGFNGIQSTIQKFTLTSAGVMPTLTSAITAAEFPPGELVMRIFYYLGVLLIGTTKGIRGAGVSDQDGSITYGPLIVETTQPCYDFAARDHYVWCATGVNGDPGVIRLDLGEEISIYRYAYANDAYDEAPPVATHKTVTCAFYGNTNQLSFSTTYASSVAGYNYTQSLTTKCATGYITTGAIRYSTLELKLYKNITAKVNNTYGSLAIASLDATGNEYAIANFGAGDFTPTTAVTYPVGAQEYMSFKFTMSRYASDSTKGPTFTGYQLKALPSMQRQRLIQYPVASYESMKDVFGNKVGHTNHGFLHMEELEVIEVSGDTVKVEDFRTGESFLGIIEELSFSNVTPTSKRFDGFGGVLLVTIRTI